MYLGNTMIALSLFLTESNPHVYRIHLSHDDLDGYSCTIITKFGINMLSKLTNLESTSPIYYTNTAKINNINDIILGSVDQCIANGFHKETDIIAFLITDISGVNPATFDILTEGGFTNYYIVIDHHQDHHNYSALNREWKSSIEKHQLPREYLVNTKESATYTYGDLLFRIYKTYDQDKVPMTLGAKLSSSMKILFDAIQLVSNYDTGRWGDWNCNYSNCAREVLLNLVFYYYRKNNKLNDFIDQGLELLVNDNADHIYNKWKVIAHHMHTILQSKLADCYTDLLTLPKIIQSISLGDIPMYLSSYSIKYYKVTDPNDDMIDLFSLISKEILSEDRNIDILVMINYCNHTVNLRTDKDNIDVSEIAYINGGGGHKKAAGFPFHIE